MHTHHYTQALSEGGASLLKTPLRSTTLHTLTHQRAHAILLPHPQPQSDDDGYLLETSLALFSHTQTPQCMLDCTQHTPHTQPQSDDDGYLLETSLRSAQFTCIFLATKIADQVGG